MVCRLCVCCSDARPPGRYQPPPSFTGRRGRASCSSCLLVLVMIFRRAGPLLCVLREPPVHGLGHGPGDARRGLGEQQVAAAGHVVRDVYLGGALDARQAGKPTTGDTTRSAHGGQPPTTRCSQAAAHDPLRVCPGRAPHDALPVRVAQDAAGGAQGQGRGRQGQVRPGGEMREGRAEARGRL